MNARSDELCNSALRAEPAVIDLPPLPAGDPAYEYTGGTIVHGQRELVEFARAAVTEDRTARGLPQLGRGVLDEFCEKYCLNKPQLVACAESAFYWFNKCLAAAMLEQSDATRSRAEGGMHDQTTGEQP